MKILLAIDGSPGAVRQFEHLPADHGRKARNQGADGLYSPLPPTPEAWALPPDYFEKLDRAAADHARSIVERAVTRLRPAMGSEVNLKGESAPGPPRVVILDEAESWGADLIVVGSHGYRAWERFLLGSVSQSVVSHAKCFVEVIRCRKNSGTAAGEPQTAKEKEQ